MPNEKVSGDAIRKFRHYKGLQQKHACKLMNISQQAYSKLERRPGITDRMFNKFCKAFDCAPEDIRKFLPPPQMMRLKR